MCDFGRFIVSIGSPCLERFGKSEKFFKKICDCPVRPTQKQKKTEGLPLLGVMVMLA